MHINFINDNNTLIIIKNRFVVIIINDYINYIYIYFLNIKFKL